MVKLTKAKQYRTIKEYVDKGYSANRIQKELRKRKMGIRRKRLLAEVRSIKEITITKEKRIKHIPKKYKRKIVVKEKWELRALKEERKPIYRMSLIIPSLPVHSRAFRRNYLGFRLNAFSFDKDYLLSKRAILKEELIKRTGKYIGSLVYAQEQVVRVETPTSINVLNADYLNGKWFFAVEKEGKEEYGVSGNL